jgi:hypothetical protein
VLEHSPYSPDLAPNFDDTDDIRSNTTAAVKAIPQNQFQNFFEGLTGIDV